MQIFYYKQYYIKIETPGEQGSPLSYSKTKKFHSSLKPKSTGNPQKKYRSCFHAKDSENNPAV